MFGISVKCDSSQGRRGTKIKPIMKLSSFFHVRAALVFVVVHTLFQQSFTSAGKPLLYQELQATLFSVLHISNCSYHADFFPFVVLPHCRIIDQCRFKDDNLHNHRHNCSPIIHTSPIFLHLRPRFPLLNPQLHKLLPQPAQRHSLNMEQHLSNLRLRLRQ